LLHSISEIQILNMKSFDTKTLGPWIWITLLKSPCKGDIEILVSRFDICDF
jgi:hypothetical protein